MSSSDLDVFGIVTQPITSWSESGVEAIGIHGRDPRFERRTERDAVRGAPEIIEVSVSLYGIDFRDALAEMIRRLGTPHQIIGGPTQLRWWTKDTRQVILETTPLMVRIVPAEWSTGAEMALFDVGDPVIAPYLWRVELERAPDGVWFPGRQRPESLDALGIEIQRVCESFASAATSLPDDLMHSGYFTVTSPDQRRWPESGLPYKPRRDLVVIGEPWTAELRQDHRSEPIASAANDARTDLAPLVAQLMDDLVEWGHEPADLRFDGYAEAQVPGKRAPKRVPRKVTFATL